MNNKSFEPKVVSAIVQCSSDINESQWTITQDQHKFLRKKKWHILLRASGNNFQFGGKTGSKMVYVIN